MILDKEFPIVVMGANASGKTLLSLNIAKKINAEIISADSRQIYKHLRAGTSKPNGKWETLNGDSVYITENVPYHLVDFLNPNSTYDVSMYSNDFFNALNSIKKRDKKLIIAGGTGMYINSIFNGIDKLPQANQELRNELYSFAEKNGKQALHEKLRQLDPLSAERIPPGNIQRVIRAIEISIMTNSPASRLLSGNFYRDISFLNGIFVFLKWDKKILKERIKNRTESEFENWVNETQNLLSMGYAEDCPALKSLGYPQIIDYINGKIERKEAINKIVNLSMSYAKRQNTWFSRYKKSLILEFKKEEEFEINKFSDLIVEQYLQKNSK